MGKPMMRRYAWDPSAGPLTLFGTGSLADFFRDLRDAALGENGATEGRFAREHGFLPRFGGVVLFDGDGSERILFDLGDGDLMDEVASKVGGLPEGRRAWSGAETIFADFDAMELRLGIRTDEPAGDEEVELIVEQASMAPWSTRGLLRGLRRVDG